MATTEVAVRIADTAAFVKLIDRLVELIDRLVELHVPVEQYAEFWWDSTENKPSPHCGPDCTDTRCKGHDIKVQVCQECGYDHEDGTYAVFRPWPCPTLRALYEFSGRQLPDPSEPLTGDADA